MDDDIHHTPAGRIARHLRGLTGLTLHTGRTVYPVLRIWDDGLALPAEAGAELRGRVDVYDGARHVFHALIVAQALDIPPGGTEPEVRCSFKRVVPAGATQPRDYAEGRPQQDDAAAGA